MDGASPQDGDTPLQVYIVDDDELVRSMLTRLLRRAGYRTAAWGSPLAFLEEAVLAPPCCVLLDVQMPELTGTEIQERLARRDPPPPVVFLSGGADVPTSVRAMKAGAVDFLSKPFVPKELLAAVSSALERSAAEIAERDGTRAARERLDRLTPRERDVALRMARGLRSKEIATELGIALKTINVHRSRVLAKLEVTTLPDLVRLLERARLGRVGG
jgi:FixJ family two-component response regulator